MDKKGVMMEEWKARRKEWMKKRREKREREKVVLGKVHFHNQTCGVLPVNLLAACQPHSLKREVGTIALWPHARVC